MSADLASRPRDDVGTTRPARSVSLAKFTEKYALVILLLLAVVVFGVLPQTSGAFLNPANLSVLASNQSVIALIAIGSLLPLICGELDLSAAPIAGLTGLVCAGVASRHDASFLLSAVVALGAALVVGLFNGFLIAYVGVGSIVVTLGTATVIQAFVSWYSDNQTIVTGIPPTLISLGRDAPLGIPATILVVVVVAALVWYLLDQTPLGRHYYFVGENPRAASLIGIPVRRQVMSSFVISALVGGGAGLLQVGVAGSASPQVGPGFVLPALAAAFLGATSFKPGFFNVAGTLVAVLFVAVIVNGLTLLGAADWMRPAVDGASLLLAVIISRLMARRRGL